MSRRRANAAVGSDTSTAGVAATPMADSRGRRLTVVVECWKSGAEIGRERSCASAGAGWREFGVARTRFKMSIIESGGSETRSSRVPPGRTGIDCRLVAVPRTAVALSDRRAAFVVVRFRLLRSALARTSSVKLAVISTSSAGLRKAEAPLRNVACMQNDRVGAQFIAHRGREPLAWSPRKTSVRQP